MLNIDFESKKDLQKWETVYSIYATLRLKSGDGDEILSISTSSDQSSLFNHLVKSFINDNWNRTMECRQMPAAGVAS